MAIHFNIYAGNTWFDSKNGEELKILYDFLSVPTTSGYWRAKGALKRLGFIGTNEKKKEAAERIIHDASFVKFYDSRRKLFGTGLLPMVRKHLKEKGIKIVSEDFRKEKPDFSDVEVKFNFKDKKIIARPEQVQVLTEALRKGNGILHCGVNFGKTEVACAIIEAFRRKTGRLPRTLFLVHRVGLAKQTADRFKQHLGKIPIRVIGGGGKTAARITAATIQTAANLVNRKDLQFTEYLRDTDLVFIDELHVNKAKTMKKVMERVGARMRFGLSGTISKDKLKLMNYIGLTGPIIAEVKSKELIDLGRSAKPIIRIISFETDMISSNLTYNEAYRLGVIRNRDRNNVVFKEACRYLDVVKLKNVMITIARISHGRRLKRKFDSHDIPCEFISGSTPGFARDTAIKKFVSGKVPVLIVSPIFDVGMSVNEIWSWINAAGGLGWELVMQRLGRVLRKTEGKDVIRVTDFSDSHNKYLYKHSKARIGFYEEEGAILKKVTV